MEERKRVLVIGDLHIPSRARSLPKQIVDTIKREKFDLVLCPGDLVEEEVLDFLSSLGRLYVVRGNMDSLPFPEREKIRIGKFDIGLAHGDVIYPRGDKEKLASLAQKMGVDILVSGHTHRLSIDSVKKEGKDLLLVDGGSATGVWGGSSIASNVPSFVILDIEGSKLVAYCFELVGSSFRKRSLVFKKSFK